MTTAADHVDPDLDQARRGWTRDEWQEPYVLVTGVDFAPHGSPGQTGLVTTGIVPPGAIVDDAPILRVEHVYRFPHGVRTAEVRDYALQLLEDTADIVVTNRVHRCPAPLKHVFVIGAHGIGLAGRDELYAAIREAGGWLEMMTIPTVTPGQQPQHHKTVPYQDIIELINGVLDQWDVAVPEPADGDGFEPLLAEAFRESRARPIPRVPLASATDETWWRQEDHADLLLAFGASAWGIDRLCRHSWFGYSIRSLTGVGRWQWEHDEYRRLQLVHDCGGWGDLCCWNCLTCRPKMLQAPKNYQQLYGKCDTCKAKIAAGMKPPPRRRITRQNTAQLLEQRSLSDQLNQGRPIEVFGRQWHYDRHRGKWRPVNG